MDPSPAALNCPKCNGAYRKRKKGGFLSELFD